MKLTLAMICKNEEASLRRCLLSVAPFVDEIVIVDNNSTDNTKEIALSFGARVFDFTPATHPESFFIDDASTGAPPPYTGQPMLADFAAARALSFEHATGDYVMWIDADDVLEGGEHLRNLVSEMEKHKLDVACFPYQYRHDSAGRCICLLWRERIVRCGSMSWVGAVHEELLPTVASVLATRVVNVVVRHCRESVRASEVANRNYKVLLRHVGRDESPRALFYFADAATHVNPDQALDAYERYVEISNWPEERCVARCYMGELYESRGQFGRAYACFAAATTESVDLPDGWFGLARLAARKQAWADCIRLTEQGLKRGNPETVIMVNPLSRAVAPHVYYNVALNALGRVQEAYDSCMAALLVAPEDANLCRNRDCYRTFLDEQSVSRQRTQLA